MMIKKHILRIYDFTRSWFYYPKMKKYLMSIGIDYDMGRLLYALWHCRGGKLSDTGYRNLHPTIKDISDDWKRVYRNEPIEKGVNIYENNKMDKMG